MRYVGIDWPYRRAAWCALNDSGAISGEGIVQADADGLVKFVLAVGPDVFAGVEMMSGVSQPGAQTTRGPYPPLDTARSFIDDTTPFVKEMAQPALAERRCVACPRRVAPRSSLRASDVRSNFRRPDAASATRLIVEADQRGPF